MLVGIEFLIVLKHRNYVILFYRVQFETLFKSFKNQSLKRKELISLKLSLVNKRLTFLSSTFQCWLMLSATERRSPSCSFLVILISCFLLSIIKIEIIRRTSGSANVAHDPALVEENIRYYFYYELVILKQKCPS